MTCGSYKLVKTFTHIIPAAEAVQDIGALADKQSVTKKPRNARAGRERPAECADPTLQDEYELGQVDQLGNRKPKRKSASRAGGSGRGRGVNRGRGRGQGGRVATAVKPPRDDEDDDESEGEEDHDQEEESSGKRRGGGRQLNAAGWTDQENEGGFIGYFSVVLATTTVMIHLVPVPVADR